MKILTLNGQIELLSGLHIGGGDDTMKIGGIDNQVIKDINTNKPYIPGSSLKGKMRSLLEWNLGLVGIGNGEPFSPKLLKNGIFNDQTKKDEAINLIKLFGTSAEDSTFGITRISVADCSLIDEGLITSEAKYENTIDRKKGTASNPRQTERVPAGVKFSFNIRLKIIEDDNEQVLKNMIEKGLELIENDYLGGNGSRGYGRVLFINKEWN
ncbi:MAG: type III-A CRISPR-associated RAMP protein Csm3 [Arcobacteraceae bacterium]|nr:type III-A CRISPR-associated RAMP protein Csm3 [Arcobacteraceae bacterium]